ncbi:MAG: amidophosphoribosyltransferase [Bacteroidetes bacterium]|jgi:amidophosphoribosyltransferase|nr:amidophosphoribosyltransferase [Bacteroidota bacterium]
MSSVKDHCGIFGIFNASDAARRAYYGLHALQHRGQESAGIVTSTFDEQRGQPVMPVYKDFGLVLDVFDDNSLFEERLMGDSAIGHTRYSTSGSADNRMNIQPFVVHYHDGNIALAHNGNLSNAREIRKAFSDRGTLFQTTSDSELILHLIAQSRREQQLDQIIDALTQIEGAFSLVLLTDDRLIAVRDPNGFRPLALGRIDDPHREGTTYCVASETCAFDILNAEYVRDVAPGEVLIIDRESAKTGDFTSVQLAQRHGVSQCIFEYVYFSRPDSKIFGEMVDKVRRKIGKQMAHESPVPSVPEGEKKPIVISVPDSSNTAALGFTTECQKLGHECRYEIGLIRNHYVGRTFIAPGQDRREMKVRSKYNTVEGVLRGRTVIVVDDSIVRGTTARQLVQMLQDAGAKEVHLRIASPAVISPCFYGMDFPSTDELLANQFDDVQEMTNWLGVTSLAYLSTDGLMKAVHAANESDRGYCNACFTANYPVPVEMGVKKEENEWTQSANAGS